MSLTESSSAYASEGDDMTNDQAKMMERMAMFQNQTSYEDLAGKITTPTLLIHGDADAVVDVNVELSVTNQTLIPGSALVRYDGIGHAPFLEAPTRFNTDVMQFVDGLTD
jgi:pimeloyl-ACP methyl ester carboxylesterase